MELKDLHHIINTHLKENSLAKARFSEDVFNDSVVVFHPNQKDLGSVITITKNFDWWHLEHQDHEDGETTIELKIMAGDNKQDISEILNFVNSHTMHETPELVTETENKE